MSDKNNTNLMTEGDYRVKIIKFALPVFIGHLFQQLYNTADSFIVGNYIGPNALAAVSSVGPLVFLLVGFFMGFSMGASIIIARYIGAKNNKMTSRAVHTAIMMGIVFSALLTIIGVTMSPTLLKWLGTPEEVMVEANTYLRIFFMGISSLIMYNTFVSILQASGDSKHPLYYLVCSSLINVVLDILFIGYFNMGVDGAATATVISQSISALLALYKLLTTDEAIKVKLSKIRFHHDVLASIIRFGLPTALQASVIDLANLLLQSYIHSFGNLAMAGVGVSNKIEGFSFLPVTAFSMAMSTFISQNIGANKMDRVRKGINFGILASIISIEAIGLVYWLLAPQIISLFNSDPTVITYGATRARICSPFYFLMGFSHVASAIMRGVGKPNVPMVVMLFCWCAVRVISLFTIGRIYHFIELAFWLYPVTWFLSSLIYTIYMNHLKKEGVI